LLRSAAEAHRERFEQIGRQVTYVNDEPGAAYISEMAVVRAYLLMAVGLLQGLRICEHHKISSESQSTRRRASGTLAGGGLAGA
jgi:hypothetical protein